MTKSEIVVCLTVGLLLGMMALLLLAFSKEIQVKNQVVEEDHQRTVELVNSIKATCSPEYPVVRASIFRGKLVIECRTN